MKVGEKQSKPSNGKGMTPAQKKKLSQRVGAAVKSAVELKNAVARLAGVVPSVEKIDSKTSRDHNARLMQGWMTTLGGLAADLALDLRELVSVLLDINNGKGSPGK